jgi:hypothetical protein
MVDGRRYNFFYSKLFWFGRQKRFFNRTDFRPTLLTNLPLFHIPTSPTPTLPTTIRFEMRNKIKFGKISQLINRFYLVCQFGMQKLKFSTETDFTDQRSPLASTPPISSQRNSANIDSSFYIYLGLNPRIGTGEVVGGPFYIET